MDTTHLEGVPGVQTLRFRRPTNQQQEASSASTSMGPTRKNRHKGLLQDQLRRSQKAPWCPSFSLAFRIFLIVRVTGAMYANITDCDEGTRSLSLILDMVDWWIDV